MILLIKIILYVFAGIFALFAYLAVIGGRGIRAGTPISNHLKGTKQPIPLCPPLRSKKIENQ